MKLQRLLVVLVIALLLGPLTRGTGLAAPPAAEWVIGDIGTPALPGSVDVDPNGVWTLKGSGDDIYHWADSFQYAAQRVKGDGSITARLLSRTGGNTEWAKTGLMIREDGTDSAANFHFMMTSGYGLHATARLVAGEQSVHYAEVGPSRSAERNLFMRLQRVGNEISGFYSRDGRRWMQASFGPQTLPTLKEEALFGLTVTSHDDRRVTTAQFDQVAVQPGLLSACGVQACGSDKSVLLQWRVLPQAAGFNLYRGPANATLEQLTRLNDQPVAGTSFTDTWEGLINGTPVTYGIAPLFRSAEGTLTEGPLVVLAAAPIGVPTGWYGCSINEGPKAGSVTIDPASGEIRLRGGGGNFWDAADQGYFMYQLAPGNVQVTVKAPARPGAVAGIMISESLDGSGRRGILAMAPGLGLMFQSRSFRSGPARFKTPQAIEWGALRTPITLRLTRQGKTLIPEYSTDDGKTFQPVAAPMTFDEVLPETLHVGLVAIWDRYQPGLARFANLEVKQP